MNEFLTLAAPWAEQLEGGIETVAGLFTRLSVLFLLIPGIGGRSVPVRVRLSLAFALLGILLPLIGPAVEAQGAGLFSLLAGEALVGFMIGFTVRVLLFALGVTGSIVAQALSVSQIFGVTADGDSASLLASLLMGVAAVVFLTADLEVAAIALLVETFTTIPLGSASALDGGVAAEEAIALTASAFEFGVMLALPFMVLNFAFYLLLGCLNRVMPQLMVTFIGLPAITLAGLGLLTITVSGMLTVWMLRMMELLP